MNQGISAEMIASRWRLSRQQLDEFALASHDKAAAAQDEGRFAQQIVPVPVTHEDGTHRSFSETPAASEMIKAMTWPNVSWIKICQIVFERLHTLHVTDEGV